MGIFEDGFNEEELEERVHMRHCCSLHGCKYGDKDCPVVNNRIIQLYKCKDCDE